MRAAYPGWLSAPEAARRYGIEYQALRRLVATGVFTRGRFSAAAVRPPIYLRKTELDAYKRGGVDAVAAARSARDAEGK
jgi:hypothetical protein